MRVEASRAGQTRRTRFGYGAAVLTALLIAAIGSVVAAAFFYFSPASSQVAASFIQAQPGAIHWNPQSRLTVLLVGRKSDQVPSAAASLTLASFAPASRSVQLLSLPTNLWVTIPGYGPGRLGDALADGGMREQLLTVESVLRVPIPYFALTGPHAMMQMTDVLGGITVHLPSALTVNGMRLPAGFRHLDGRTSLAYAGAAAGDPPGALAAMQRQQSLLFALKHQTYSAQNFFRIPGIISSLGASISTNFPYDQVLGLVRALQHVPNSRMRGDALSYLNGSVSGYDAQNGEVSLPDWQHIRAIAQRMIPAGASTGPDTIRVLNGTGVAGEAVTLADWLRGDRLRVRDYASGPAGGYAKTEVMIASGAAAHTVALAQTVATLLQVPVTRGAVPPRGSQVLVCLGRDYQAPIQQ